jgi:LETM1 and EF-hand domain-containing protein 1
MLPSTFKEESKEQEKIKKQLKAKLEMAKFLQDTLEETALTGSENQPKEETVHYKFAEFMKKIRSKGVQPTTDDILKYSALFENELTLDNLSRQQLIALCQILEVNTYGNIPTNDMLKFQLKTKIRTLEADDQVIVNEGGVGTLTSVEVQQACRDRGMRALGVSEARLRAQLDQWLDLHLTRKIPVSLLILSRALYLPENLAPEELIKSTISALPDTIVIDFYDCSQHFILGHKTQWGLPNKFWKLTSQIRVLCMEISISKNMCSKGKCNHDEDCRSVWYES